MHLNLHELRTLRELLASLQTEKFFTVEEAATLLHRMVNIVEQEAIAEIETAA